MDIREWPFTSSLRREQGLDGSEPFFAALNRRILGTDKGVENAEVRRLVLLRRVEGRRSILQGSSVHRERIERLWRDMRKMVTEYFRRLFYFLMMLVK